MSIREMATAARGYIGGVNWGALGMPVEDAVYDIGYLDQIVAAFERAERVRGKLALSWEVPTATSGAAWHVAEQGLLSAEGAFVHALNANQPWMTQDIEIETETWRAFVSKLYMDALHCAVIHRNLILQVGGIDPETIARSADAVVASFSCIVGLWEMGVLDPLRADAPRPAPVRGLGDVSVPALVTIGAVLAVAVIAAAVVMDEQNQMTATMADDLCAAAINEPDPERKQLLLQACTETRNEIIERMSLKPGEQALNTAIMVLSVGVLVYGGVMLVPHLVRAWRRPRAY